MSVFFHSNNAAYLGFHGDKVNTAYRLDSNGDIKFKEGWISSKFWNRFIALNLIPVIGNIIAGIMHAGMACRDGAIQDPHLFARGIAELTIIGGIIFAIGDIVVTVGRMCTPEPSLKDESE